MICLICRQTETVDGLTSVAFESGDFDLIIKSVPARTCPSCADVYVEETVAVRLLEIARQRYEAGKVDTTCEYSTF